MKTVSSSEINYNDTVDLSTGLSETEEIKKAIEQAESAMAAPAASKPLVPTKKAAKLPSTKRGKAGRIVGISKDENEFLQTLLLDIIADHSYDELVEKHQAAYDKLVARYNK